MQTGRPWAHYSLAGSESSECSRQFRLNREQVGLQTVVGHRVDRSLGALVDRNNYLPILHARQVLDGPGDAGNLSSAARRLKVSLANVSYQLQQLKKLVGVQLVRRTTRRIEPTEVGQTLYRHRCAIRDELAAAREAIDTLGRGLHGAARVNVPNGFGQLVMTGWQLEFKRQYPDINLELLFENRVDALRATRSMWRFG